MTQALVFSSLADWGIPIAALVIAISTFVAGQREIGRRAKTEYVDELEARVQLCETDRADLRKELKRLSDRELDLLRRIVRLEDDQ